MAAKETGSALPGRSTFVERLGEQLRTSARPVVGRLSLRDERGFTLVEAVLAMMLFAIVSVALTGLLTSSVSAQRLARERTLAEQTVSSQVEWIRQLPYDSVGIPGGNPSGTIVANQLKNVSGPISLTGLKASITTKVQYVADPTPNSYATQANYKMVTVTLLRSSDSHLLSRQVTFVAPPGQAPYGGINLAIINAQVIDMGSSTPMPDVPVALSTGPSAPRSDITDSTGTVTFPALTANAVGTYYDITPTVPAGYTALSDDVSPASAAHVSLAPGQTFNTALRLYQGSTIYVNLKDQSNATYAGNATVSVSSSRGSETFGYTGTPLTITMIAGEKIVPGVSGGYTVTTSNGFYATPLNKPVPNSYPSDLTQTFTLTGYPTGSLTATVTWAGSPVSGAAVTVTGGPTSVSLTGTTNGSGVATFTDLPDGSGYTVTATKSGQSASGSATVVAGTTTNVPLALPTGTLAVTVTSGGSPVSGATVAVTGGPLPVGSLTTNAAGVATFTNVPASSGYTVTATKGSQSASQSGVSVTNGGTTNVALAFPMGSVQVTVTWAGSPVASCANCVTLSGGGLGSPVTGSTDAAGVVTFTNVPAATGYTVTATKNGQSATQTSVTVTGGSTTFVALQLPTGSVAVTVTWVGAPVASCASCVTISGGNLSGPVTGSTNSSGVVTFINVPAGTGYTVSATKNGFTGSQTAVTVTGGSTTPVAIAMPTATLTVNVTWGQAKAADGATVTVTGGPNSGTYTGTISNGTVNITVPQTSASFPYNVSAAKAGATTGTSTVTSVPSGGATTSIALTPTKVLTITVQRGGIAAASTGVSISVTGGPIGATGSNPAATLTGTTNALGQITITLPSGAGTYTIKVYLSTCGASGSNRSGSGTVSAAAGTTTKTINMTSSTCPFSPLP